jgi:hypothetical protein
VIDIQRRQVSWIGLAFSDGQGITLNAAGAILHGPVNVDPYLMYVIEYPGGRAVPLTRSQFHQRIGLDDDRLALQWVLDMAGTLKVAGRETPLSARDVVDVAALPPIESVTGVDLSDIQLLTGQSFDLLSHFSHLELLNLSGSPIRELPDLMPLTHLKSLNLSRTAISDVSVLRDVPQLTDLNLAHTSVGNGVGDVLRSLPRLETVDLSHTQVGDFDLLDLRSISTLRQLDLTATALNREQVQRLRAALPQCEIVGP